MTADRYKESLDEYKEICAYHRSEDQLRWQVLGITYGAAALLASTALQTRFSLSSMAIAVLAAFFATAGTAIYFRLHQYTLWRLERAWELEENHLGFRHHIHVKERDASASPSGGPVVRLIRLGYWLPWLLAGGFAIITLIRRG